MKTLLVGLLLGSLSAQADIKSTMRDYSQKILGSKITQKVFGDEQVETAITLPKIPGTVPKEKVNSKIKITSFEGLSDQDKRNYYISFIKEISYSTRGIKIDKEGIIKWLNVLEQGGSQEGIYRAMVLDGTYQKLETFEDPLTNKVVSFVQGYGAKYLNQNFKEESLKTLNIYSIKRIITEKSLEMLDYFMSKPDEMYRWYAIFSSEIAKELRTNNKVRAITDTDFHYKWAQKVPMQHIKSEMIIKLHEILNQFNEKLN